MILSLVTLPLLSALSHGLSLLKEKKLVAFYLPLVLIFAQFTLFLFFYFTHHLSNEHLLYLAIVHLLSFFALLSGCTTITLILVQLLVISSTLLLFINGIFGKYLLIEMQYSTLFFIFQENRGIIHLFKLLLIGYFISILGIDLTYISYHSLLTVFLMTLPLIAPLLLDYRSLDSHILLIFIILANFLLLLNSELVSFLPYHLIIFVLTFIFFLRIPFAPTYGAKLFNWVYAHLSFALYIFLHLHSLFLLYLTISFFNLTLLFFKDKKAHSFTIILLVLATLSFAPFAMLLPSDALFIFLVFYLFYLLSFIYFLFLKDSLKDQYLWIKISPYLVYLTVGSRYLFNQITFSFYPLLYFLLTIAVAWLVVYYYQFVFTKAGRKKIYQTSLALYSRVTTFSSIALPLSLFSKPFKMVGNYLGQIISAGYLSMQKNIFHVFRWKKRYFLLLREMAIVYLTLLLLLSLLLGKYYYV